MKKKILIPAILLLCIGLPLYFSNDGLCFAKMRYLTEEEIFDKAIEVMLSHNKSRVRSGFKDYVDYKPYKNLEEFYKENPNCCSFWSNNNIWDESLKVPKKEYANTASTSWYYKFNSSVLSRLLGDYKYLVKVDYKGNYYNGKTRRLAYTTNVSNCGNTLQWK